jgi:hypothetical protein
MRMGPVKDDLTAVQFQVVVEYRNGSRKRPVKPMPFELSSASGKVLRYVDPVFSWIRVVENNGLRKKGERFQSRLAPHEIVRIELRSRLLRPPHPLARYTKSLVLAEEFKTPARVGSHRVKSGAFHIVPWKK